MQIKTKQFLTMLAMVGISAAAFPAKAATVATGDLLLYFRASAGTGASTTVMANLGSAPTLFRDATGDISSVVDLGTLLTSTYGASWNTRADVYWGIGAANSATDAPGLSGGDPYRTSYLSVAAGDAAPAVVSSAATGLASSLVSLRTRMRNETGTTTVAGAGPVALATSLSNTWEDFNTGTNSFGLGYSVEQNFDGASNLDLYRLLATGSNATSPVPTSGNSVASLLGTFSINSAGVVSFDNVAAVPEPSRTVFAALGLGALLLRRRRSRAA